MNKQIIILAGGKGTRMNGADLPKVLVEINGKTMIESLLESIDIKPVVVVGYQAEKVKAQLGDRVDYVLQEEQLGTGHAVACARENLEDFDGPIIVLYGDHPLVSRETINKLFDLYQKNKSNVAMLTTVVSDFEDWQEAFFSYGRILRNEDSKVKAIREMKDCTDEEKSVKEVNPGYYCFDSKWLWENIDKLKNQNQQGEYYLTDLVEIAVSQNDFIPTDTVEPKECLGINTREQLKFIEGLL